MDFVLVGSGKLAATSTASALSTKDTPCTFVRVSAPAVTGPASSNTDGIWVGAGSTLSVVVAPSNWTGEDIPCNSVGKVQCKAMGASAQVLCWTAFAHRG